MLSAPTLLFVFFEELIKDKDLALVRGDLVDGSLTLQEAHKLYQEMIMFYMTPDLYSKFIYTFNHDQNKFNWDEYTRVMDISRG